MSPPPPPRPAPWWLLIIIILCSEWLTFFRLFSDEWAAMTGSARVGTAAPPSFVHQSKHSVVEVSEHLIVSISGSCRVWWPVKRIEKDVSRFMYNVAWSCSQLSHCMGWCYHWRNDPQRSTNYWQTHAQHTFRYGPMQNILTTCTCMHIHVHACTPVHVLELDVQANMHQFQLLDRMCVCAIHCQFQLIPHPPA